MIRFIIGKARSGKTARIIDEIRETVQRGEGKALLLVPEQYSHEAERELCLSCWDRLSLHAEVMSFTAFARWGRSVYGGSALKWMDEGGKLLCMTLALREISPFLNVYEKALENTDLQTAIVHELDILRAANAENSKLRELSLETNGNLRAKLSELALIQEAYEAMIEGSGAAAKDPLALLAYQLEENGLNEFDHVYIDGFLDFTGQELRVLKALIKCSITLTICLPGARQAAEPAAEYLYSSKLAYHQLLDMAEDSGAKTETIWFESEEDTGNDLLGYFAEHMFDYAAEPFPGETGCIRLLKADNPQIECEAAAAEILRAVRDDGLRWRDFAVAVRGFDDYRIIMESVFRRYDIPLFITSSQPLSEKALPYWIESAYDLILGNWEPDDMISYLRCGFSGLSEEDCDALCSYIYLWQLKAASWIRKEPWMQHPDGYGKERTAETEERLEKLNQLRHQVAAPLLRFKKHAEAAVDAVSQAQALVDFLEDSGVRQLLQNRVKELESAGELELRAEYTQLWDIVSIAIEQTVTILGTMQVDTATYYKLLKAVLSRYEIGMIPVALDRVSAGDFDRMRRRNIRRLIVLGCYDGRLPPAKESTGIFSSEERDELASLGLSIGGGEAEFWREYALIYHTLSLPNEKLILSCPDTGFSGEKLTPAIIYTIAKQLVSRDPENVKSEILRVNAPTPALGLALAVNGSGTRSDESKAAYQWFMEHQPERLLHLLSAVNMQRGTLSAQAVRALYGKKFRISPSRLESFESCHFGYYCRYGMKAQETEPAGFHPPELGTFVHYVLENTVKEVNGLGGFKAVNDSELHSITEHFIEEYVHNELGDYSEKSVRFRWLFERMCEDVYRIVQDSGDELRLSDFEPLSFELDISNLQQSYGGENGDLLKLTGIADRVDGFQDDNGLHLRIVDYKTGNKQFHLYDILYGRNMQMLMYLFAICDHAEELYGRAALPAGIMYLPARENLLHFDSSPVKEDEQEERIKQKRRSGLILEDPDLIEAWEHGEEKKYMPRKGRKTNPFITWNQMDILRRQASDSLCGMANAIANGIIEAKPLWSSESDNACRTCPYHKICRFEEGENGETIRVIQKLSDEEVWEELSGRQKTTDSD